MAKKTKKAKAAKKPAKKAKKAAPKKAAKKSSSKKAAKKPARKKAVAKKAKKPAKKIAAKKPLKQTAAAKEIKKPVEQKPVPKAEVVVEQKKRGRPKKDASAQGGNGSKGMQVETSISDKPLKPSKTKKGETLLEEDEEGKDEVTLQYEIPETFIRPKSKFPQPKPFVPKKEDKRPRYSDKELAEFKEIVLEKLNEAKKDYELLKATLTHKDDHGTDDTSPTFKLLEDGSDVLSKEETAALAARQEKFIQNLQNALVRIENKTYGICRATGKLIPKERLRSVPHATLSIGAKLEGTL